VPCIERVLRLLHLAAVAFRSASATCTSLSALDSAIFIFASFLPCIASALASASPISALEFASATDILCCCVALASPISARLFVSATLIL